MTDAAAEIPGLCLPHVQHHHCQRWSSRSIATTITTQGIAKTVLQSQHPHDHNHPTKSNPRRHHHDHHG